MWNRINIIKPTVCWNWTWIQIKSSWWLSRFQHRKYLFHPSDFLVPHITELWLYFTTFSLVTEKFKNDMNLMCRRESLFILVKDVIYKISIEGVKVNLRLDFIGSQRVFVEKTHFSTYDLKKMKLFWVTQAMSFHVMTFFYLENLH